MKRRYLAIMTVGLCAAQLASAAIIDATTNDGGFEDGAGSYVAPWAAVGFNNTVDAGTANSSVRTGDYAASIGTADGVALQGVHINTGYAVAADDQLQLSFYWAPRHGWIETEELNYRLFTTSDNTTAGTVDELSSGVLSGKAGNWNTPGNSGEAWYGDAVTDNFTVSAASASVGQQLFVEFYVSNADANSWARVDDVTLQVVPEPATLGLLGAAGAVIVFFRRRLTK